jgi:hypothetical protein
MRSIFIAGVFSISRWIWLITILVVKLILTAAASLLVGVIPATERLADDVKEMVFRGNDQNRSVYAPAVHWIARVIAFIVIAIGWFCYSYVTVFVVETLR